MQDRHQGEVRRGQVLIGTTIVQVVSHDPDTVATRPSETNGKAETTVTMSPLCKSEAAPSVQIEVVPVAAATITADRFQTRYSLTPPSGVPLDCLTHNVNSPTVTTDDVETVKLIQYTDPSLAVSLNSRTNGGAPMGPASGSEPELELQGDKPELRATTQYVRVAATMTTATTASAQRRFMFPTIVSAVRPIRCASRQVDHESLRRATWSMETPVAVPGVERPHCEQP